MKTNASNGTFYAFFVDAQERRTPVPSIKNVEPTIALQRVADLRRQGERRPIVLTNGSGQIVAHSEP